MANYEKRSGAWRARIFVNGQRESGTFKTKGEAVGWATQREAELIGGKLPDKSVRDAFRKYASEVSPTHKGSRWEFVRLTMLESFPIASVRLERLKPADIATWRDSRLQSVSAGTVAREMNVIKSVLEVARKEWGWIRVNPMTDVKRPSSPASRKRRVSADEVERLTAGFGLSSGLSGETATQRTGLAFLFALETAMRAGEILGLRPEDIRPKSAVLPDTKNGDAREVPLSKRAREILAALLAIPALAARASTSTFGALMATSPQGRPEQSGR